MAKRRIIFVPVLCLSIMVLSVQALTQAAEISEFDTKAAELLNVNWCSIRYEKLLYNPALTSNRQSQPKAERLSISCRVDMPDSSLVLGTSHIATLGQITDTQGMNIEIESELSRSSPVYGIYNRFRTGFMSMGRAIGPEYNIFNIELDPGLREQISGDITLKGYFYALVAESLEQVDLPFEPSEKWVSITDDVQVRVREARNEASRYHFDIEQIPQSAQGLMNVRMGDYLPSRFVINREIVVQRSSVGSGGAGGTGMIAGTGSGTGRAEKIRFTVAVNPAHQKIPFEMKQIPLSVLTRPVPSTAENSDRKEFNPLRTMPEQIEAQFNKKVADCFDVKWSSVVYSKTVDNPAVSNTSKDQSVSESLLIRCEAEILDSELIVGTSDIPVIENVNDGKGRETNFRQRRSLLGSMSYRTPGYQTKFSPPSKLFRLEAKLRAALRLPLLARHRPKRGLELKPVRLRVELDPEMLRVEPREIRSIKGYFHTLTSKSFKHVKIPFKSSDKWVRLTPDIEIQLPQVNQTGTTYRYEIKQRQQGGRNSFHLLNSEQLPGEMVVNQEFIAADGRSGFMGGMGGRQLTAHIGSSGSIGGRQVKEIDFKIAVSPSRCKIPFEIKHIPLPEP